MFVSIDILQRRDGMKIPLCVLLVVNMVISLYSFHMDNINGTVSKNVVTSKLPVCDFFSVSCDGVNKATIVTSPLYLLQAAKDSLAYLNARSARKDSVSNPVAFRKLLSLDDVKKTLKFVISTIEQDRITGNYRILDSNFLKKHFSCIKWSADWHCAQSHAVKMPYDGRIRLTMYGVFSVKGNHKKTSNYSCGLYKVSDVSICKKYTKQQILAGALEKTGNRNKCSALAWVSRQSLEDALMHGTVVVNFPDGGCKILNVDKHNGIAYDRSQKNIFEQKRYWFFRELKSSTKQCKQTIQKFKKRRGVVFAGDLYHIGFGKLIALSYKNPQTKKNEMRLGILADTGGAFINNLYQLDLFGGVFGSHNELTAYLRTIPTSARAVVLYKK